MSGRSIAVLAAGVIGAFLYFASHTYIDPPARMYAPETAAIKAIQTLSTAQVQYNSQYGRFARSLSELAPPAVGPDNASAANLISSDLAAGEKQGCRFALKTFHAGYAITAVPSTFCGSRTFYSDQSLVIRESFGPEPATANSKELGSTPRKAMQGAP
jgi:type IV pilus assembly protein PilA